MEATFVLKPDEFSEKILAKIESLFVDRNQPITITVRQDAQPRYNSAEVLRRMREFREKYPPAEISADIDINKLIDEMNWEGNH
ncbi:hypothetical protein [Spirosoma montaniterrae]|uniref:Uncharacterized protein n=1 Tax=Spirosoma montaniterrae TaxID=1178516 RepID=A0A1P9WYP4_9BACT|nr:hypothetical protein [Spirosoma montaniterrae]AQG80505.1 hypothetical protein AWR27_14950 [Spirosoma montaniterrae]